MPKLRRREVADAVQLALAELLIDSGIKLDDIRLESSLIDDLGLDSLKFVDLTLAIEDALGLKEFPMQEWVDAEALKSEPAFTVAALVKRCVDELGAGPRGA